VHVLMFFDAYKSLGRCSASSPTKHDHIAFSKNVQSKGTKYIVEYSCVATQIYILWTISLNSSPLQSQWYTCILIDFSLIYTQVHHHACTLAHIKPRWCICHPFSLTTSPPTSPLNHCNDNVVCRVTHSNRTPTLYFVVTLL
jgi:hypothetical protein